MSDPPPAPTESGALISYSHTHLIAIWTSCDAQTPLRNVNSELSNQCRCDLFSSCTSPRAPIYQDSRYARQKPAASVSGSARDVTQQWQFAGRELGQGPKVGRQCGRARQESCGSPPQCSGLGTSVSQRGRRGAGGSNRSHRRFAQSSMEKKIPTRVTHPGAW